MKTADIYLDGKIAGQFREEEPLRRYVFTYVEGYAGRPISWTLPVRSEPYEFNRFPPFFDGLLPEGSQLEALLRGRKLDRLDYFEQLLAVGEDLPGNVMVKRTDG